MAEEIRLVGSFQDNITPKLKKLNREINSVTKSFTKMQKKLKPIARDMGKLAAASERVADGMKNQRSGIEANIRALNQYKSTVGKVAAAQKRLKPAAMPAPKLPKGGGAPMAPMGGYGGAALAGGAAFGATLGATLSQYMTQAITMGFEIGTNILKRAFSFLGWAIKDGIEDEMSDIQSAGGMFALDKKNTERLFTNFTQARNMQESLNRELAKSAASLPGATADYVNASKQLTDTVFGTYVKDKDKFADLATSLGGKQGDDAQAQITQVLKKFTEQSVLLSQGAGKGGMPLGMLLEQLITMDQVNMDSMKRRYAQLRKNPLLANMLADAEESINQAGAGTAERFKAVMDALDNALPEEVVNSMRRSVSGVMEATRSAFLDQEVGLLGLRRPLSTTVTAINEFGQFVDKNGKVVDSAAEAAREQTTVFKLIRDVIAGFGLPLSEIAGILPQVFDPLEGLASGLMEMREMAVNFSQMFDRYSNFFKQEGFEDKGARAALASFTNFIADLGGMSEEQRVMNIEGLMGETVDYGELVPRIMQQVINSPLAEKFGEMIGTVLGQTVATVAQLMTGVLDGASQGGFAAGFAKAWEASGGTDALKTIFGQVFKTMGQLLLAFVTNFPFESLLLGLAALAPAIIAGLSTAFALALPGILSGLGTAFSFTGIAATISGWLGAIGPAFAAVGTYITGTILPGLGVAFGSIGTFITGTALPAIGAAFSAVGTFITGTMVPAITAAASAFIAVAAPVLAVVGAVMGLVAIFRHLDFILSSFGHAIVMVGKLIESGFLTIIGNILKFVGNIPGLGGLKDKGQKMLDKAAEANAKAGERMNKINENTAKSLERTASDFEKMGNLFKGRGFVSNEEAGIAPGGPGVQATDIDASSVEAGLNGFTSAIGNFFTKTIPDAFNAGMTAVSNFVTQTIPQTFMNAMSAVGNFITQTIPQAFGAAIQRIEKFFVEDIPYAIGYAVGMAVQGLQNVWNGLVQFFTVTIPTAWTAAVEAVKMALMTAWNGVVTFFQSIPGIIMGLFSMVGAAVRTAMENIKQAFMTFVTNLANIPSMVGQALSNIGSAIANWVTGLPGRIMSSLTGGFSAGKQAASSYAGNTSRTMGLGQAIATENKNKPAGSHLVIANSSETVIPAFKGYVPETKAAPAFKGYMAEPAFEGAMGSPSISSSTSSSEINVGGITVNVSGVEDPRAIADQVAEEILRAITKNTYTEIYTT